MNGPLDMAIPAMETILGPHRSEITTGGIATGGRAAPTDFSTFSFHRISIWGAAVPRCWNSHARLEQRIAPARSPARSLARDAFRNAQARAAIRMTGSRFAPHRGQTPAPRKPAPQTGHFESAGFPAGREVSGMVISLR
jgi:hypothetical protein